MQFSKPAPKTWSSVRSQATRLCAQWLSRFLAYYLAYVCVNVQSRKVSGENFVNAAFADSHSPVLLKCEYSLENGLFLHLAKPINGLFTLNRHSLSKRCAFLVLDGILVQPVPSAV
jgi:hypothetical protein